MKKILVVADPVSEKPIAIKRASELAARLGCSLHIVHFCFQNLRFAESSPKDTRLHLLSLLEEKAAKLISKALDDKTAYSHEVVWEKHIHKWVKNYAQKNQPELIVKTGHRSETMLYTPTDWLILRECKSPVLITAQSRIKKSSVIMAAIDMETEIAEKKTLNTKILNHAAQLAKSFAVDLHLVYCPPVSPILRDLGMQYSDEIENKTIRRLAGDVDKLAKQYKIPRKNIHIKAGEPEKAIPSVAAKYHADILVMGTVGRAKLSGKLIGNTAENILRLLRSDVLTLKP